MLYGIPYNILLSYTLLLFEPDDGLQVGRNMSFN